MMKPNNVAERINAIQSYRVEQDYEAAYEEERWLLWDFVEDVVKSSPEALDAMDPRLLANAGLLWYGLHERRGS